MLQRKQLLGMYMRNLRNTHTQILETLTLVSAKRLDHRGPFPLDLHWHLLVEVLEAATQLFPEIYNA